ncbi:MAG: ketopantoate reductase family protein [Candidatus Nealsonbacteria bacterium]
MEQKIAIIGVGGRTGTMFAFELRNSANVLGVARGREVKLVKEKKLFIERKKKIPQVFEENIIKDTEFKAKVEPDTIFLTTKNPVSPPIKYYFTRCRRKPPSLLISQNGIAAISEAKESLRQVLGKEAEKVRIIRIALFNPIDKRESGNKTYIKYSLPVRIALSKTSDDEDIKDIVEIFEKAGFEIKEFPSEDAKNLEFSKLFLNLIGMAAASRGASVEDGFKNKEIFKEEVKALREYIKTVKLSGGEFLNFPRYPVKLFASLFGLVPTSFLLPFRSIIAKIVSKGRGGKPKDLDEIDYYNGAVVNLGKKTGVKTPVNEKIYKRALERLK